MEKMNHNEFPPTQCRKLCKKLDFHFQFSLQLNSSIGKTFFKIFIANVISSYVISSISYIHSFCTSHEFFLEYIKIESKYVSNRNDKWERTEIVHIQKILYFLPLQLKFIMQNMLSRMRERKHHFETILCDVEQNLHTNRLLWVSHRKLVLHFFVYFFELSLIVAYLPSSKRETIQICEMLREYFTIHPKKRLFFLCFHS